jgi:hypothetical protein
LEDVHLAQEEKLLLYGLSDLVNWQLSKNA